MADEIEVDNELELLSAELRRLVQTKAHHQAHLHELPAAQADNGSMKFCPGCRAILVSRRLSRLFEARDDSIKPPRKEKSLRDEVFDALKERRLIED